MLIPQHQKGIAKEKYSLFETSDDARDIKTELKTCQLTF